MPKDLGMADAYAFAVSKGYTGTREEFAELMASYADVAEEAQEAREGAEAAQTGAETARNEAQGFAQTASEKASQAAQSASQASGSASTASEKAQVATTKASEASQSATTASNKASEASGYATTASNKASEASASAQTATTAKDDAVTAKNGAVTAKTGAETAKTGAETAKGEAEQIAQDLATHLEQIDTNTEDIADINETLERKANIDGYYEDLTSGNAEQIVSTQYLEDKVPYHFRTSGGSLDIGNREEDMLVGGSIVWNQLVRNGNFADGTANWGFSSGSMSADNGVLTVTIEDSTTRHFMLQQAVIGGFADGHVYVVVAEVKPSFDVAGQFAVRLGSTTSQKRISLDANVWNIYSTVSTATNIATGTFQFFIPIGYYSVGTVSFRNIILCDLTQMFGSTVADAVYAMEQAETGAGVAWFRKLFPNDYYEYNSGELMHVEGVSVHETVGKNLFDSPVIALSPYNGMTFNKAKFFKGGFVYTISVSNVTNATIWRLGFRLFDANGDVITYAITNGYVAASGISDTYNNGTAILVGIDGTVASKTFTLLKDAYIVFCFSSGDVSATTRVNYQVEIGNTATAYEPYVKHTYPLDDSLTLRGIPKIDVGGNLYYDGDTYESDGTVTRKYGIVDLGTLSWSYATGTEVFYCNLPTMVRPSDMLCTKYPQSYANGVASMEDKTIWNKSYFYTAQNVIVKDSSYTDAATFKSAMSGVMLVYELAEPTIEVTQPYHDPQIVDNWGTEEYVTDSIVPVGHATKYPANLRDKIQHLPDLASDEGNYIINQQGQKMTLVRFRIPSAPSEDGTYILRATVSNGTPTYTWESEASNEG